MAQHCTARMPFLHDNIWLHSHTHTHTLIGYTCVCVQADIHRPWQKRKNNCISVKGIKTLPSQCGINQGLQQLPNLSPTDPMFAQSLSNVLLCQMDDDLINHFTNVGSNGKNHPSPLLNFISYHSEKGTTKDSCSECQGSCFSLHSTLMHWFNLT